jgi:hypothetical protein
LLENKSKLEEYKTEYPDYEVKKAKAIEEEK